MANLAPLTSEKVAYLALASALVSTETQLANSGSLTIRSIDKATLASLKQKAKTTDWLEFVCDQRRRLGEQPTSYRRHYFCCLDSTLYLIHIHSRVELTSRRRQSMQRNPMDAEPETERERSTRSQAKGWPATGSRGQLLLYCLRRFHFSIDLPLPVLSGLCSIICAPRSTMVGQFGFALKLSPASLINPLLRCLFCSISQPGDLSICEPNSRVSPHLRGFRLNQQLVSPSEASGSGIEIEILLIDCCNVHFLATFFLHWEKQKKNLRCAMGTEIN